MTRGVALTDGEEAGAIIAAYAAKAVKKSTLELCGSDASVMLGDADIDKTVEWAVYGRHWNAGRVCVSEKRLFVATVTGIADSRSEIVTLRRPDGGAELEWSSFARPDRAPGFPDAMSTERRLRSVASEVDDLRGAIERLAADGYSLAGDVGQYEHP